MDRTTTVNPYLGHPKDHRATEKLWERFQQGDLGEESLRDLYQQTLVSDWQRCRRLGISPTLQAAPRLPHEEFAGLLQRKDFVLTAARQTLAGVSHLLEGVPGILVFADEMGNVLHIMGEPAVRELAAESIQLVEGGCWGEGTVGSNGIGTAIAKKKPVHVFASEHFCEGWHTWTCAAAPVLDPFQGQVLGVVDFSTLRSEFRSSSLALAYSLATNIRAELLFRIEVERVQLRQQFSIFSGKFPSDPISVYDRLGLLVCHSSGLEPAPRLRPSDAPAPAGEGAREVRPLRALDTHETIGSLVLHHVKRFPAVPPATSVSPEPAATRYGRFVTANDDVCRIMQRLQKIAATDLSVLLIGETGTGKELVAQHLHAESQRRDGPFVAVNCGAISRELFESRFFGYERGGFTGADPRGRKGLFESANHGTLFLDEIGELPLEMQAGFLRVLESGTFRRIGSDREHRTDCRIIAATNRSLLDEVEKGNFRSDLYYRLSVTQATIPPLRQRSEDIAVLTDHLARKFCAKHDLAVPAFASDALQALQQHGWPGNVRELRNVVEATVVCAEGTIGVADLPTDLQPQAEPPPAEAAPGDVAATLPAPDRGLRLRDQERELILVALQKYKKISLAARSLGISRSTLYRRLEEFGINPSTRS